MSEITASILEKKIIFKKFKLRKLLDTSDFSWVYEGKNIITNDPLAMKIEKKGQSNLLESEAYFLSIVKGFGIPEIISFGKYGPFKILIEELLGKNILALWKSGPLKKDPFGKNKVYINDICLLAKQGIERLKYIHDKNLIHRDIKPKNFVIGRNDPNNIYLIDFGFAKKYMSSRTGKHIRFSNLKMITGSLSYASHNVLKGYEGSRRDDLESFGYMLIYLARIGWIPWKNYLRPNLKKTEINKIIIELRLKITDETLCQGLPNEFIQYMKYVKKLDFEQEPDYQYLDSLFTSILSKNEMKKNLNFFWINQKPKKKEKKLIINNERNNQTDPIPKPKNKKDLKSNYIKRLYSKIKNSLNKNKSINAIQNTSDYNKNNNNTKIYNTAKKINFHIQIFNTNTNDINIDSINKINSFNKSKDENINLTILNKDKIYYKRLINLDNKIKNRTTKFNSMDSVESNFQNDNSNKNNKSLYKTIKINNHSLTNTNNIILNNKTTYHNIFSNKKTPNIKKINFGLNKTNNEINNPSLQNSTKNLILKKNIIYKPVFKKIKIEHNNIIK